ncbi:MAG TPA: hypothetical protein DEH02_03660, partial [Bacteroidales bacterium]|nr:hypothetical protein [Bacteroidales bacterium]
MKIEKLLFIALLILLSANFLIGQVTNYSFTQVSGTLTPLTATYTQHTSGTTDNATYNNISIGFTFNFNGTSYSIISICNDGWIAMGSSASQSYDPLSSGSSNNVIAALANDLQGLSTGSLRSKLTGSSPSRKFTIEWLHYELYGGADDYSFQIVLTETSNTIEIYYSSSTIVTANTFQVGIRGSSSSDYNNRTKTDATSWLSSSSGSSNADVMTTGGNTDRNPQGIFTWTPVSCSGTPTGGSASATPTSVCSGLTSVISVTGQTSTNGISFQWEQSADGSTGWTNVTGGSGATTTSYTTPTLTTATYYRCKITCTNSGLSAYSSNALVSITSEFSCYCTPTYSSGGSSDYVTQVSFEGLSQGTASNTSPYYINYTGTQNLVPDLTQSVSYNLSLTFGSDGNQYNGVWIDFDRDGTLETSEFFTSNSNAGSNGTVVISIAIPAGATTGQTLMRIRGGEDSQVTSGQACEASSSSYGQAQDYKVNIVANSGCTGTPTGGSASAGTISFTCSGSTTITVAGYTNNTGITLQWQSSPSGAGTWSDISGATSNSVSTGTLTASTDYRCKVTCTNSSLFDYSTTATVTINANVPGSAAASPSTVCPSASSSLTLTGSTIANSTYLWQSSPDNTNWSNISGATSATYSASPTTSTYYRCAITCTAANTTLYSASVLVTVTLPAYATLPVNESFEGPWISSCDTRDAPTANWLNTPNTGDNSWRRHDDGIAAAGWTSNSGLYSPVSTVGSYSAEFNSYNATDGTTGSLDLYVNLSPAGIKLLKFDYINPGSVNANDKMVVLLSTDGGSTFPTTLLTLPAPYTTWSPQYVDLTTTSATSVIRFLATSDDGSSAENTGIDNLKVLLPCSGTPTGGTASAAIGSFTCSGSTTITLNSVCPYSQP